MRLPTLKPIIVALCGFIALTSRAEDIDIYTQGTDEAASNVLVFIDNSANWSNASQQWDKSEATEKCELEADEEAVASCTTYTGRVFGDKSKLAQGQVELRALKVVLEDIACREELKVNVGLMLFNARGTADGTDGISGYVQRRIISLPTAKSLNITDTDREIRFTKCKTALAGAFPLVNDLIDIDAKITNDDYKGPQSAEYGAVFYEAFKYFGGYARTSGKEALTGSTPVGSKGFGPTRYSLKHPLEDVGAFVDAERTVYKSPIAEGSCGKNFMLLIGNQFPKAENEPNSPAKKGINGVLERLGLTPPQLNPERLAVNDRYADEWADFLAETDISSISGHQPLKTFAINVFNRSEDPLQTRLLDSIAKESGANPTGAFKVDGNVGDLIEALKDTFLQISAKNSAFASASLPISVNTQGTYLNQVFIGMFRPDGNKRPRWAGNLKQYEFKIDEALDASTNTVKRTLFLADADGNPAIDNTTAGFLKDCASSFWTSGPAGYWTFVDTDENRDIYQIPEGSCPGGEFDDKPDGSVVERGGAAQRLRVGSVAARKIFSCSDTCTSSSELDNATAIVAWARGTNVGDGYNAESAGEADNVNYGKDPSAVRPTVHGGVIHARPLAINYATTTTNADGSSTTTDKVVVFYGADDGLLRAINGDKTGTSAGEELWSFLAPEFLSRLQRNRDNFPLVQFFDEPDTETAKSKDYFFDGSLGAYAGPANVDGTGLPVKYLYASMRRGGRMIYAFDITAHPNTAAPGPLWRFGCWDNGTPGCVGDTGVAKIGQTWSSPRIVRVKNASSLFALFGAGYDDCEDSDPVNCPAANSGDAKTGRGVYVLNAVSGKLSRFIDFGTNTSDAGHVVADITPVDVNNDGYADLFYAADTRGNLWRVNMSDPNPSNWIVTQVATIANWTGARDTQSKQRKFLYAPDVVTIGAYNVVLLGTGNREKPLQGSSAALVKNRFYGFWDEYAVTSASLDPAGKPSPFITIDDRTDCDAADTSMATLDSGCHLMNTTTVTVDYQTVFSDPLLRPRGWVIDLQNIANEQVVTSAATIGGLVNFSTFQAGAPKRDGVPLSCNALGTARGYSACFLHGGATCGSPPPAGTSRANEFVGGGLPPSPVTGVVQVDGKIVPFIIGGKPGAEGGSALEAKLPPIPIKKYRTKVYRYKKID